MSRAFDGGEGTSLPLQTLVLLRELPSGLTLAHPLAQPDRLAAGEEPPLDEVRLFLEHWLPQQPPEVQARQVFPPGTELVAVEVPLPRDDLPRRVQLPGPVTVSCAVVPGGRGRWLLIPALDQIVHLQPGEDLDEVVRAEVSRVVAARNLDPDALADLLPHGSDRLEPLELCLDRSHRLVPGRARGARRRLARRRRRKEAAEVLDSVGEALHRAAAPTPPLLHRDEALRQLSALLGGEQRHSVLISGEPLTGKSALVRAWLRRQRGDGARPVYATGAAQLIAGMSGLGQWQERVQRVMRAAETLDAVLYFEDLGELFGDHEGGQVDLAGAMRPYLLEERVRLLGELRPAALDKLESRRAGFFSALQRIALSPLDAAQTRQILHARREHDARQDPQSPTLAAETVDPLVDLTDRYLPYQAYPGRAVALYEELRALQQQTGEEGQIGPEQLYAAFSRRSGVPVFLLRQDRALKLEQVLSAFAKRIVGQKEAVCLTAETVCIAKAGLQPPGKPLANLLFVGPTGVGKTEVARTLARFLFGDAGRMVRFDMSEFTDPLAPERLIQGSGRDEGLLTRKVRQQPFCVLLLDEIEKAHPGVFDLLLQVLGEGRLTDAAGRTASFQNAIVIMTSNLGVAGRRAPIGLERQGAAVEGDRDYYQQQVRLAFRPEFVGRLDRVVPFHPLSRRHARQVTAMAAGRLAGRRGLLERGIALDLSDAALERLTEGGYSADYGARPLKQHLERAVMGPLAQMLAHLAARAQGATLQVRGEEEEPAPGRALAEVGGEGLSLRLVAAGAPERRRGAGGGSLAEACRLRRRVDADLALEPAQEVKEQVELLEAQLNTAGRTAGRDPNRAVQQQLLQVEQHRLSAAWQRAESLRRELHDAEEMALCAVLEEEDPGPFVGEARAIYRRFEGALFELLVAERKRRDGAAVLVQELDDRRGLDPWLGPLAAWCRGAGVTLTVHLADDPDRAGAEWPAHRRLGPPRDAAWVRTWLGESSEDPRTVLLRISGPNAGIRLALEAGLHLYPAAEGKGVPARLFVALVRRAHALPEEAWGSEALQPTPPAELAELRRQISVRRYVSPGGPCKLLGGRLELPLPLQRYWAEHDRVMATLLRFWAERGALALEELLRERYPQKVRR